MFHIGELGSPDAKVLIFQLLRPLLLFLSIHWMITESSRSLGAARFLDGHLWENEILLFCSRWIGFYGNQLQETIAFSKRYKGDQRGVLLLTCPFTTNPGNCCSNSSLDLLFQNSMFLLQRDKTDETNANSCTHWHVYMNIYVHMILQYTCIYWKSMIISHILFGFGMTKQLRSQPHAPHNLAGLLSLSLNYRNPPEKIRKDGTNIICFI